MTDEVIYRPDHHDSIVSRVWFDLAHKHERIDIDIRGNEDHHITHNRSSFIFDFEHVRIRSSCYLRKHTFFEIHYNNHTATCTKHALHGEMHPPCLSRNAHHRGHVTVGGVLTCDNWIERHDDHHVRLKAGKTNLQGRTSYCWHFGCSQYQHPRSIFHSPRSWRCLYWRILELPRTCQRRCL